MSAGLPGVGLSGLFFIASALLMLPLEVLRTVRGRSSVARWVAVLRHFATAVAMIAALELFYAVTHLALSALAGGGDGHRARAPSGARAVWAHALTAIPLLPLLVTIGLVVGVLCLAKLAELISRAARTQPAFAGARAVAPARRRVR